MTVQTISNLTIPPPNIDDQTFSMIDRMEGLIHERLPNEIHKKNSSPKDNLKQEFQYERSIYPFRRDTNFDEQDFSTRSSHPLSSVKTVISALADLIFGFPFFVKNKSEETLILLKADQIEWNDRLSRFYPSSFNEKVSYAFASGSDLIKQRISFEKSLRFKRLILIANALFASITFIIGKRENSFPLIILGFSGLAAGTVWFFYMVTNYVTSKLRQTDLESEMRLAVVNVQKALPRNITPLSPSALG